MCRTPAPRLLMGIALLALPANGQILPLDPETQVNTTTTGDQRSSAVALAPDGESYVVVWVNPSGSPGDTSSTSITGQRFDREGNPLGREVLVNEFTTGTQTSPDLAFGPGGELVVVWTQVTSSSTDPNNSIRGRLFDEDGTPQGGDFQVNTYTPYSSSAPAIDRATNGDFVVAWMDDGPFSGAIRGRRFDSKGLPEDPDFQVSPTESPLDDKAFGYNLRFDPPAVDTGPAGEFIVAWSTEYSGPKEGVRETYTRSYDADGSPGSALQVLHPGYLSSFSGFDVGRRADGEYIVVWGTTFDEPVQLYRYQANGALIETQVAGGLGSGPLVDYNPNGDFLITWRTQEGEIVARPYDSEALAQTEPVRLDTLPGGLPVQPAIALDRTGIVATWTSNASEGTDDDGRSIQQRRFEWTGSSIFADGFESGDTSAWVEGTVP